MSCVYDANHYLQAFCHLRASCRGLQALELKPALIEASEIDKDSIRSRQHGHSTGWPSASIEPQRCHSRRDITQAR